MNNKNPSARDRELRRAQLTARLSDKQRQLAEYSDRAAGHEKVIRECREQLEEGRDRKHLGWFVPTLILLAGGAFFLSLANLWLSGICFFAGAILFCRWLASLAHCSKKHRRVIKRLRHNEHECDQLNDKTSVLRLEVLEIRQELDRLDRE